MNAIPSPADDDLDRVEALRLVITRLARRLRRHSGADLTSSQMSALTTLELHGRIRLGRLAELEGVGKSTMTRQGAKLESLGLVTREVDEADARSWQITLTSAGKDLLEQSSREAAEYLARQMAGLDAESRRRLEDALPALEKLMTIKA